MPARRPAAFAFALPLAVSLMLLAGCGGGTAKLPQLGAEIEAACLALPAEIVVAAAAAKGEERWILAAPYRSEAAYESLGIEIEPASVAALVQQGNEGPECLLVARLVDGRLVEFGHPPAACTRGIHLDGERSAEPGVLALRVGDRLRLEAMPGGGVAISLAASR